MVEEQGSDTHHDAQHGPARNRPRDPGHSIRARLGCTRVGLAARVGLSSTVVPLIGHDGRITRNDHICILMSSST